MKQFINQLLNSSYGFGIIIVGIPVLVSVIIGVIHYTDITTIQLQSNSHKEINQTIIKTKQNQQK